MWTDDWIGLPYAELGRGPVCFDCLGLFLALQRERHGRELFDPNCTMTEAARQHLASKVKPDWTRVERPTEGAAVLFRVWRMPLHIGYAIDNRRMLHTSQATGESVIEDFRASAWGTRLEGVYIYG